MFLLPSLASAGELTQPHKHTHSKENIVFTYLSIPLCTSTCYVIGMTDLPLHPLLLCFHLNENKYSHTLSAPTLLLCSPLLVDCLMLYSKFRYTSDHTPSFFPWLEVGDESRWLCLRVWRSSSSRPSSSMRLGCLGLLVLSREECPRHNPSKRSCFHWGNRHE